MQMFRKPVQKAKQVYRTNNSWNISFYLSYKLQGDRVGICVTQFDAKTIERCLISNPNALPTIYGNNS